MLVATLDAGASVSGQEHLCQADACWVPSKSFLQETRRSGGAVSVSGHGRVVQSRIAVVLVFGMKLQCKAGVGHRFWSEARLPCQRRDCGFRPVGKDGKRDQEMHQTKKGTQC